MSPSNRPSFPPHAMWTTNDRTELRACGTEAFDSLLHTVKAMRASNAVKTKKATTLLARQLLPGSVADVAAFYLDVLECPDVLCEQMNFDDTELIYVLKPLTPLRSSALRGICVMDSFIDNEGRRGWAYCMHSVVHPSCPDFKNSAGLVRSTVSNSGIVVLESNTPGVVEIVVFLDWDLGGNLAPWTRKVALAKRMQLRDQLDEYLKMKSLEHRPAPRVQTRPPSKTFDESHQPHSSRTARVYSHHASLQQGHRSLSLRSQPSFMTSSSSPTLTCAILDEDSIVDGGEIFEAASQCAICLVSVRAAKHYPCQQCHSVCGVCSRPWYSGGSLIDLQLNLKVCVSCDHDSAAETPRVHNKRVSSARRSSTKHSPRNVDLLDLSYISSLKLNKDGGLNDAILE
ncbi:hypothetical protein Ae201684P_004507 [Aphanomyces euteiches]|nr:hypothetical protein Ae201684P_004507 [Aphanomyces euteiches]